MYIYFVQQDDIKFTRCLSSVSSVKNFKVIKKCRGKLECLIYEMLLIKNKRPKLNTQADSIRAKLFTWANAFMLSC